MCEEKNILHPPPNKTRKMHVLVYLANYGQKSLRQPVYIYKKNKDTQS